MSIEVSLMRNKEESSVRSMRNREQVIVKTPDAFNGPNRLVVTTDSRRRSSTFTGSDTESQRENLSVASSSRDCASDKGRDSSDGSVDVCINPEERARSKLFQDRRNALDELISTEKSYIEDLAQIVQGYMYLIKREDIPKPESLTGKELVVFGNLQQIYEWHKNTFQPEMEKYIDIPQKLGTIFTRFEKRFYMYVKYCENKPKSEDVTYEHLDYFERLREILDHKLQLADMLIKPVQRIMKYELLLKAIMKYTEKAGEDVKEIQRAIEVMCIIPRAANDMMNVGRLQGFDGKVTAQGRLLLQDTIEVSEQTSKSTLERISFKERKAFLFEQIIIFSKTVDKRKQSVVASSGLHYMYCSSLRVNKMILTEMPSNPLSFRLVDKSPASPVVYLCQCKSESIKRNWIVQVKILLDNQRDFLRALQSPISYVKECSRIESGDASESNDAPPSAKATSKKPPKSIKKNKSSRSFKNLFIKSIHETSNNNKNTNKNNNKDNNKSNSDNDNNSKNNCGANNNNNNNDATPATGTSRKFSLPFFEVFATLKTPEVESKTKWSMLTSLTRSKVPASPQGTVDRKLLRPDDRSSNHLLSVSNENICADKSSDSDRCDSDDGRITVERIEPKTAGNFLMRNPMLFREIPKMKEESQATTLSFAKELENVSSTEGCDVHLSCRLTAWRSSSFGVTWSGPSGENVVENDDVIMENCDGCLSLKLSRVLPSHSGMYKCKVGWNKEAIVTSCHLKVLPEILPKPKRGIRLNSLSPPRQETAAFSFEAPTNRPESTVVQWSHNFEEKYELLKVIERGKFSVLHVCRGKKGGKNSTLAAKSYPKSVKTKDSVSREFALSSSTEHPGVIRAVDLFETEDSFIILFPFFSGRNKMLDYIVNLYSFDDQQATLMGHQLFSCLVHLHDRNILHLAIKPENFDIDLGNPSAPILKLMDFGDARLHHSGHQCVHHFAGDSEFTPPEIIHGSPLTLGSDVWCAAIIFYAILSGTTPFFGGNDESTRKNVVSLSYAFPKNMAEELDPSVLSFLSSILVMPPSQRPNAQECLERSRHLQSVAKRNRIDKRLFSELIARRRNLQL